MHAADPTAAEKLVEQVSWKLCQVSKKNRPNRASRRRTFIVLTLSERRRSLKSVCCSSEGPEFGSQRPHQVAHPRL